MPKTMAKLTMNFLGARLRNTFFILIGLSLFVGCGSRIGDRGNNSIPSLDSLTNLGSPIMGLELDPANPVIGATGDLQFTVNAVAYDGTRRNVTHLVQWTNSDGTVLSADAAAGLFRAAGAGASTITASLSNHQISATVTVNPAQLVSLQFSPALNSLPRGVAQTVALIGVFSDGSTHDLSDQASWSSSDSSVVAVSNAAGSKGQISVVNTGSATIEVAVMGQTYSQAITGTNATLNALQVHVPAGPFPVGLSAQLTVSGSYSDGTSVDLTSTATWESSDASLASANFGGVAGSYLAVGTGMVTATARVAGLFASAAFSVAPASLSSIEILPAASVIPNGTAQAFTAVGHLTDGQTTDLTALVQWSAGGSEAVLVPGESGKFRGVQLGTTPVIASYGNLQASASLQVNAATLTNLSVNLAAGSVALGGQTQASAAGTFSDGTVADLTADVAWSVSDPTWASVSNSLGTKGLLQSLSIGSGTITATYGSAQALTPFTVTNATLVALHASTAASNLAKGIGTQLTATASYSDGTTADVTAQATWTSAAPVIASVGDTSQNKGAVSTLDVGNASFTASFGGQTANVSLTVASAALNGLSATGGISVAKGSGTQVHAIATYTDGSTADVTAQASWTTLNASIATVSNGAGTKGAVNGINLGAATIRASFGGLQANHTVAVTAPTLTGLALSAASASLAKGLGTQLTATATYSDGTTANVTGLVTWNNATPTIASVTSAGALSSLAVGSATITVSLNGLQASVTVNITAPTVVSVKVNPASLSLLVGYLGNLTATATYTDGTTADVTNSATWSSSHTGLLTVTNTGTKGRISVLAVGDTTITASFGGFSGHCAIHSTLF